MTEKNQVKEVYPPKKEEKCKNFSIFTQSFALLLGLYWLLKATLELKMDILSNEPHLVSLQ